MFGITYNRAANSTFPSSPFISPIADFLWLAFCLTSCFPSSAAAFIALSKMVSTVNRAYFERTSSRQPTSTMQSMTNVDNIAKRKKHISISGEIAIPKTIIFPTATTPTRFVPGHPLQSKFPLSSLTIPPKHSHLFKTPITLNVGPALTPFPLHLEALLSISPFFTATFNPHYGFRESLTSSLSLPTHNPQDFEYFVQWLYTRTLTHESLDGPHPAYFRLIRLWKVADWLQVQGLKNAIVDEMARRADATNSVPTPDDTRNVFGEGVGEEMGVLRELVSDLFVWYGRFLMGCFLVVSSGADWLVGRRRIVLCRPIRIAGMSNSCGS